jgi:predicted site-specific integrase-resolvase
MKLSVYAKKIGIPYRTAHSWWQMGYLNGKQYPSGTILIDDSQPEKTEEEILAIKEERRNKK